VTSSSIPVVPHTTPLWVVTELLGAGCFSAVVVTMGGAVVGVVDASTVNAAFDASPGRAIAALPMRRTEVVPSGQPLAEAVRHLAVGQCDALLWGNDEAPGWLLLPDAA